MKTKREFPARRNHFHKFRSYWFVLLIDPNLPKVDSNRRRTNKDAFLKRKIRLDNHNDDPEYFRQCIAETFPELDGRAFTLCKVLGNSTVLTPIRPEVNNAVALCMSEELNRSCVYIRPEISDSDVLYQVEVEDDHSSSDQHCVGLPSAAAMDVSHPEIDSVVLWAEQLSTLYAPVASEPSKPGTSAVQQSNVVTPADGRLTEHMRQKTSETHDEVPQVQDSDTSSTALEENDYLATCGICHQLAKEPRTLPCLDSFCLSCLEEEHNVSVCPKCGETFEIPEGGVKYIAVSDFIDKMAELRKISNEDGSDGSCEICSQMTDTAEKYDRAVRYCLHCRQKMCLSCDKIHRFLRATKDHVLVDVGAESCQEIINRSKAQVLHCHVHDSETPTAHCHQCNVHICHDCVNLHTGHELEFLTDDVVQKCWANIDRCKGELSKFAADNVEHHKTLQQELDRFRNNVNEVEREVCRRADELIRLIEQERQSLLMGIAGYRVSNHGRMTAKAEKIKSTLSAIRKATLFADELCAKGSTSDALLLSKTLSDRVTKLIKTPHEHVAEQDIVGLTFTCAQTWNSREPLIGTLRSTPL